MAGSRFAMTIPWVSPKPTPTYSVTCTRSARDAVWPLSRDSFGFPAGADPTLFITSCMTLLISSSCIGYHLPVVSSDYGRTLLRGSFSYRQLGQDLLNVLVRPWNHVDRNQFANLLRGGGPGIRGGLYGAYISPHHGGHKTCSYFYIPHQLDVSCLDHGIRSFDHCDKSSCFD